MSSNTHGRGVVTLTANPSIDRTVVLERGQVTHIGPSRALSQDLALRRLVLMTLQAVKGGGVRLALV